MLKVTVMVELPSLALTEEHVDHALRAVDLFFERVVTASATTCAPAPV